MKQNIDILFDKVVTFAWDKKKTTFLESFRINQLQSKRWLVHELVKHSGKTKFNKIAVLGSWNSILLYELMQMNFDIFHWDFFDIDDMCHTDRDEYFNFYKMIKNYNSFQGDAVSLFSNPNFDVNQYDLIINTSCEHMIDIPAVAGPLYALTSSNNDKVSDHINCVEHHKDLSIKNGINSVIYEGSLTLGNFKRFCVIGYRNE
jgi:hypothetical protein